MFDRELINGFYFVTTGPTQKRMTDDSVERVNEMLADKFDQSAPDFGGVLARAYVTFIPNYGPRLLSLIFTTTTGGKNDFFVKGRLDFVQELFEKIFDSNFAEVIIQTPKANQREMMQ